MSLFFYHTLSLVEFLLVVSIGIALVSILLHYLSNNFNIKLINIYGFFSNMDNFSLLLLSSAILKEITLVYCIIKLSDFKILYLYIFLVFCFIYAFFSFKVSIFIKELVVGGIEYLIIYFLNLLSSFLVEVRYSEMVEYYIWMLSIVLACCSIYFFARNLSAIVERDKHVRRNLIGE